MEKQAAGAGSHGAKPRSYTEEYKRQGWVQPVVATRFGRDVAMAGRRRSDRALRGKLGSPGRPGWRGVRTDGGSGR